LVEPTPSNCNQVVKWFHSHQCLGSTATLQALQVALLLSEVQGIYFLSDGKPNCSKTTILREIANKTSEEGVKIHTIAYHYRQREGDSFLKLLAHQTKGRYHQYESSHDEMEDWFNSNIDMKTTLPVLSPSLEGDDIRLLLKEISLVKKYLQLCANSINAMEGWKKPPIDFTGL